MKKGFTLLEVIVSVTIVAVGLVAIIQMMEQGVRVNQTSERRQWMIVAADAVLRQARFDLLQNPQFDRGAFPEQGVYREENMQAGLFLMNEDVEVPRYPLTYQIEILPWQGQPVDQVKAMRAVVLDESKGDQVALETVVYRGQL